VYVPCEHASPPLCRANKGRTVAIQDTADTMRNTGMIGLQVRLKKREEKWKKG
jgi:hypothetical protein